MAVIFLCMIVVILVFFHASSESSHNAQQSKSGTGLIRAVGERVRGSWIARHAP